MASGVVPVSVGNISTKTGISAAVLIAALILSALGAVTWRAEGGLTLNPSDWAAVRFTIWQAMWSAFFSCLLAVPVARAMARRRFWGRSFLITLLGAPFLLPVIVAVLGLLAIFGRSGLLNDALTLIGFETRIDLRLARRCSGPCLFQSPPWRPACCLQGWQSVPAEQFRLSAQLGTPPAMVFQLIEKPLLLRSLPGRVCLGVCDLSDQFCGGFDPWRRAARNDD